MRRSNRMAAVIGLVLAAAAIAPAAPAAAHGHRIVVRPGESIQAALDAARPGTTVVVRPGEYRENLEIVTDGITLEAHDAVLRPPTPSQPRRCSELFGLPVNNFGLCIAGELLPGRPPVVVRPVNNVTVRGLAVLGFAVSGIMVQGAHRTRIEHSEMEGGSFYGLLVARSSDTKVIGNRVIGGDSGGLYVGDAPEANAHIIGNEVVGSGQFGIFVRQASHGSVVGNLVTGSCVGIGLVASIPDPTAVNDWLVSGNRVSGNNRVCEPEAAGTLAHTGIGIIVAGARNSTVSYNLVEGNTVAPDLSPWGGGIVLAGDVYGGPPPASNRIVGNVLRGNLPADLTVLDSGTGNTIAHNLCRISSPAGLCAGR